MALLGKFNVRQNNNHVKQNKALAAGSVWGSIAARVLGMILWFGSGPGAPSGHDHGGPKTESNRGLETRFSDGEAKNQPENLLLAHLAQ